ncbi:hypothetical protein ACP70R_020020 [Stipagrostis hirtigluma subsp. patula]
MAMLPRGRQEQDLADIVESLAVGPRLLIEYRSAPGRRWADGARHLTLTGPSGARRRWAPAATTATATLSSGGGSHENTRYTNQATTDARQFLQRTMGERKDTLLNQDKLDAKRKWLQQKYAEHVNAKRQRSIQVTEIMNADKHVIADAARESSEGEEQNEPQGQMNSSPPKRRRRPNSRYPASQWVL